ncbi:MAG: hypothetical protein ACTTKL_06610 [Treponema sp.]
MKKMRTGALAAVLLLTAGFAFAANNSSTDVRIDYKLDIAKRNHKTNHFYWTLGNGETVKDGYDAVSGASMKGSTTGFNVVRYSEPIEEQKAAIPAGLRILFLFAVNDWSMAQDYNLTVTKENGVITARYVTPNGAYEVKTDKNGKFDPVTGVKKVTDIFDRTGEGMMIKSEYLKPNGNPAKSADLAWDKIEHMLEADTFSPEAAYHYEGMLNFTLKNNILSVAGTMSRSI